MIPPQLQLHFPAEIRARGDQYFTSRRVRITHATPVLLTATVKGTDEYLVEILADPQRLIAGCSCPYAADNGTCKHLWATFRQADLVGALDLLVQTAGREWNFMALTGDAYDPDVDPGFNPATFDELSAYDKPSGLPTTELPPGPAHPEPRPAWRRLVDAARAEMMYVVPAPTAGNAEWPADRRIVYIIDIAESARTDGLAVGLATEKLDRDGAWSAPGRFQVPVDAWQAAPDPLDRQLAQMLLGAVPPPYGLPQRASAFVIRGVALDTTLRLMCETGRCRVRTSPGEPPTDAVRWDGGPPWSLRVRIGREDGEVYTARAVLQRAGDEMPLGEPVMLHATGVMLARGAFARFDHSGAFPFVKGFRDTPTLHLTAAELPALLEALYTLPRRPELDLPSDSHVSDARTPPHPGVAIHARGTPWRATHLRLQLFFAYGNVRVTWGEPGASVFDRTTLTVHHRDVECEAAARAKLTTLGVREEWSYDQHGKSLCTSSKKLAILVPTLVAAGWRVEADGAVFRTATPTRASVRSGVDWFELDAGVRFGDIEVSLHDLLVARRTGATTMVLSDGSRGVLPLDWLARLGPLAAGGAVVDGALRYSRSQVSFLDALLATLPEADVDVTFERARTALRSFDHVAPSDPPRTFRGTLREYQREGLGWLNFLREFGLGGCLADDMGLGKTVQVLAMLDARRGTPARPKRPSIVVVPRSLVFNWLREAERFTPRLRMLDHSGTDRSVDSIESGTVDLVITTYGTLRRDAAALARIQFDYAILDEAQAIKTAGSASAKAARLLRADHRLALTGTPIENRIEELWSLFEFLNPGMLGASSSFAALARLGSSDPDAPAGRDMLVRALRPVILRRTKEKVASDLPARIEQTLSVELEGAQRKFYDDLLEAYRRSVLERVDRVGMGKAKMHILEALLRLRQAACHPVLADPRKVSAPSAKLDALIPALGEVVAEGHKALVFSQFTSFLALVRERLDAAGVCYEYLDGDTRDRQARVDRFQNDAECPLFLISLKAGGHGLNLTAADYVFILDPWWNPAVEAQAIDRAHRIGQVRRVIATRIVAQHTIEEKILELQATKRALADAILGQDQGVLAGIGREELEMLLR